MRFGRVSFIHRTQVRVAAHFEFLQLPLFVQTRGQRVAAHNVLVLLCRSAACKSQTHRRLFKYSLLRMDRDRLRARVLQLGLFRIGNNGDLDVVAQFKALVLVID